MYWDNQHLGRIIEFNIEELKRFVISQSFRFFEHSTKRAQAKIISNMLIKNYLVGDLRYELNASSATLHVGGGEKDVK